MLSKYNKSSYILILWLKIDPPKTCCYGNWNFLGITLLTHAITMHPTKFDIFQMYCWFYEVVIYTIIFYGGSMYIACVHANVII